MRDTATAPSDLSAAAFIDLQAQRARIGARMDAAIARVLEHGSFIMGPEVAEVERKLAARCGAKHVISCSSGTTAIVMALMARDVGRGNAVFLPSFTFTATAEAPAILGATPIFVDVLPDTFDLDPASLERAVAVAKQTGLRPACVLPVDLFGQPADYDAINSIAAAYGLWTLGDAAQSFGAFYKGRALGTCADITATSFYPSKPLGCYGDGGALFTDDEETAKKLRQVRVHGQGSDRNENVRIGLTGRFDTIQAAVLLEKLAIFDDECKVRNEVAARYAVGLKDVVTVPVVRDGCTSVWAQYTVLSARRDRIAATLRAQQIPTQIFYLRPIHTQPPYRGFPVASGGLPVTERLAQEAICLPMHPYLSAEAQSRVIAAVRTALV